eukprot:2749091-Pyramimonas_sp.AAC.2
MDGRPKYEKLQMEVVKAATKQSRAIVNLFKVGIQAVGVQVGNSTSFYGSSCASIGEGALNTTSVYKWVYSGYKTMRKVFAVKRRVSSEAPNVRRKRGAESNSPASMEGGAGVRSRRKDSAMRKRR